ncbi:MAG: GntR family transcriptional regulator [Treponema sp.]|jgi:GntR family transcriptional regulator|nr:GntR family transcriptional regulator [Treponema sp.]
MAFTWQVLNRNSSKPLYAQLKSIIKEKVENGEWCANEMIPSENELASRFGISRMTARSVVTQLVAENVLYRVQGKGTFVCEDKIEMTSLSYAGIRSQLEKKGYDVETRLLDVKQIPAGGRAAQRLAVAPGSMLYEIKRIRIANKTPISYHHSFIPLSFCEGLEKYDLQNEQLCDIMSVHYGLRRTYSVETLESSLADDQKANVFGVGYGFPLILLQDVIFNTVRVAFEYSRVYFRGDKVTLRFEHSENS